MKREELMINDIVFDYTNSPVKVCAVGQDIVVKNSFGIGSLEPNELSPIPLTEEILVKNGFRIQVTDDNSKWLWVTDNSWLAYSERHNYWYYEDMKITYVHQLQHLLRLVGVQKEIEL